MANSKVSSNEHYLSTPNSPSSTALTKSHSIATATIAATSTSEIQIIHSDHDSATTRNVDDDAARTTITTTTDQLLYALYFVSRFLVLLTSCFLCIIASLYAIGNIVSLEATNFFCPSYSEEEIRKYNLQHNAPEGQSHGSCFYIDRQRLNYDEITALNLNIFSANTNNPTVIEIIICLIYIIITTILLLPTLYYSYLFVYDVFYEFRLRILIKTNTFNFATDKYTQNPRICRLLFETANSKKAKINNNRENNATSGICICCNYIVKMYLHCVKSCQMCYFDYVMPYYYVDSKWRLFSIIFREFIEIFIQFYALLLYGGINLFDFNSNSKKLLTQHPDTVEAFAIIIGLNSVCGK